MAVTQYPPLASGQRFTAALASAIGRQFVIKPGTTNRISTTTPTDDPDLVFAMPASTSWFIEMRIIVAGDSTADFRTAWSVPAGASSTRMVQGPGSSAADVNLDNISTRQAGHAFGTNIIYGARPASAQFHIHEWAYLVIDVTAGNVGFQWAQSVSTAVNTSVLVGSMIIASRLT